MRVRDERVHHYHYPRQRDPNAAQWVVLAFTVLSMLATWLFVRHLEIITYTLWGGLAFVGALIVGFFVTVFVRCGLNERWLLELMLALLFLGLCAGLVSIPWTSIDRTVIDAANEANSFWQFFSQRLTHWGRMLVLSQMAGMCFVALTACVILLRGLHILSLAMADPENPYGASSRIALFTMRTSGWRGIASVAVFGALALYMLVAAQNPDASIWSILPIQER